MAARARAGDFQPNEIAGSGRRLHRLPALQKRHPDRLRRRPQKRRPHVPRRTTGRSGGSKRETVHWTGRPDSRPRPRRSRDRSQLGLRHEHGEAFQMGAARETPHPPEAELAQHAACRPWFEAELRVVRPKVLVCLGSTAAQALFGSSFPVTRERGKVLESELAPRVVTTVHPSSLLRQPGEESRRREYALFVEDLGAALRAAL